MESDSELIESLLRRSRSWAYVDALSVKIMGPMVETHPGLGTVLDRWSGDGDFWLRRAAMLTLLDPLRRGDGDWERFVRYADAGLDEREFFIRKAIGWILREVGKKHPERVRIFLEPRIERASGVTVREAVKYLPEAHATRLLDDYRSRSTRR